MEVLQCQKKVLKLILCNMLVEKESRIHKQKARKKRIWAREWILRRQSLQIGTLNMVHNELLHEDLQSYQHYLRMDEKSFNKLLKLIEPAIAKQDTNMRQCISAKDRLSLTLRFLATGETFRSLHLTTRISESAISYIIPQVCVAIWNILKEEYLHFPNTVKEWGRISDEFLNRWNIPNTVAAMDGKHICFIPPRSEGSRYWNYKGSNSIVLLGLVDADYKFIYVDVGCNGRVSDGGVFSHSNLAFALKNNLINLPAPQPLPGSIEPVPYMIICDEAFHLDTHILKPYPFRGLTEDQRIYNYRISRARGVVENVFGILANRFRIFLTKIHLSVEKVECITLAACVLHNFLRVEMGNSFLNQVDQEREDGSIVPGIWRSEPTITNNLVPASGRAATLPLHIRELFKQYFITHGKLPWQNKRVYGKHGVILNNNVYI